MNPVDSFLSKQRQIACDPVKELEPAVMAPGEEGEEEGRVCRGQQFSLRDESPSAYERR